jgi:hypothetical protein
VTILKHQQRTWTEKKKNKIRLQPSCLLRSTPPYPLGAGQALQELGVSRDRAKRIAQHQPVVFIYGSTRAMKGEVDQLHKKISLGVRLGFSELRPRLTLSHPPTFGIFGNCYDDCAAI